MVLNGNFKLLKFYITRGDYIYTRAPRALRDSQALEIKSITLYITPRGNCIFTAVADDRQILIIFNITIKKNFIHTTKTKKSV